MTDAWAPSPLGYWNVIRVASYRAGRSPSYDYRVGFPGMEEVRQSGRTCVVSVNGSDGPRTACREAVSLSGVKAGRSGTYSVSVVSDAGKLSTVASWVFTRPADVPPVLAPSRCAIGQVSQVGDATQVLVLRMRTNGKCVAPGSLQAAAMAPGSAPGPLPGSVSLDMRPAGKGRWTLSSPLGGPVSALRGWTLAVTFVADGLVENTASRPIVIR